VSIKKQGENQIPISRISSSVASLLENLCEGKYTYYEKSTNSTEMINLSNEYAQETLDIVTANYKKCYSILGKELQDEIKPIPYNELREQLSMIRRTEDAIFDITATSNHLVSDISAISMAEGISSLYTFESFTEPQFGKDGWKTLIHHLEIDSTSSKLTYQYVNLLDTTVYKECVRAIFGKTLTQTGMHIRELNEELIEAHKKRLKILEVRSAREGSETPPQVLIEIQDIQTKIKNLLNEI
jgi:hypothetical protein